MDFFNTISLIKNKANLELPGVQGQSLMRPSHRSPHYSPPSNVKASSVLLLIYPIKHKAFFSLIVRSSHFEKDVHKGQISFPGGKKDIIDSSFWDTAIRECEEELGVSKNTIHHLVTLTDLYIPVSNFYVQPFIGYTDIQPDFTLDTKEVSAHLQIPLHYLFQKKFRKRKDIPTQDIILKNIPYFNFDNNIVWGATAMILAEFIALYEKDYPL